MFRALLHLMDRLCDCARSELFLHRAALRFAHLSQWLVYRLKTDRAEDRSQTAPPQRFPSGSGLARSVDSVPASAPSQPPHPAPSAAAPPPPLAGVPMAPLAADPELVLALHESNLRALLSREARTHHRPHFPRGHEPSATRVSFSRFAPYCYEPYVFSLHSLRVPLPPPAPTAGAAVTVTSPRAREQPSLQRLTGAPPRRATPWVNPTTPAAIAAAVAAPSTPAAALAVAAVEAAAVRDWAAHHGTTASAIAEEGEAVGLASSPVSPLRSRTLLLEIDAEGGERSEAAVAAAAAARAEAQRWHQREAEELAELRALHMMPHGAIACALTEILFRRAHYTQGLHVSEVGKWSLYTLGANARVRGLVFCVCSCCSFAVGVPHTRLAVQLGLVACRWDEQASASPQDVRAWRGLHALRGLMHLKLGKVGDASRDFETALLCCNSLVDVLRGWLVHYDGLVNDRRADLAAAAAVAAGDNGTVEGGETEAAPAAAVTAEWAAARELIEQAEANQRTMQKLSVLDKHEHGHILMHRSRMHAHAVVLHAFPLSRGHRQHALVNARLRMQGLHLPQQVAV